MIVVNRSEFGDAITTMLEAYDKHEITKNDLITALSSLRIELTIETRNWLQENLKEEIYKNVSVFNTDDFTPIQKKQSVHHIDRIDFFHDVASFEVLLPSQYPTFNKKLNEKVADIASETEAYIQKDIPDDIKHEFSKEYLEQWQKNIKMNIKD